MKSKSEYIESREIKKPMKNTDSKKMGKEK